MACLTPIHVRPKKDAPPRGGFSLHAVPCGKCANCRLLRIQQWVFRLRQEMKVHTTAWFVTLTYDIPPRTFNGRATLTRGQHGSLTKFFKRLRKNTGRKGIKYYAVGEYGSKTERPHYHMIIFDVEPEDVQLAWLYDPGNGHCHFGQVTSDSIAYCAKYCAKPSRIPMYDDDDRVPEFSVMSKGLGANYLTPAIHRYHSEGLRSYVTMPGGATHALPRYYRDRIFTDAEKELMNDLNESKYSGQLEKQAVQYGYNLSLPSDHPDNDAAMKLFYRSRFFAIIAANDRFNSSDRSKV